MKTSIDSSVRQTLLDASVARGREKERDAPDELWTLAVTSSVLEQVPRLSLDGALGVPGQAGSPPDGSAPGDGDGGGSGELAGPGNAGCRSLGHAGGAGDGGAADAQGVPAELCAEVSDERLGKLRLHVARAEGGLDIVISVADSHVKALIEAERATLMKTLKDAGLRVASVKSVARLRLALVLLVDGEELKGPARAEAFVSPVPGGAPTRVLWRKTTPTAKAWISPRESLKVSQGADGRFR